MNYSINLRISILFILAFIFICSLFASLGNIESEGFEEAQKERVIRLIKRLKANTSQEIKDYFSENDYKLLKNKNLIRRIYNKGDFLYRLTNESASFIYIEYNKHNFLHVKYEEKEYLFKNERVVSVNFFMLFAFLFCVALIIALYFSVLKSLAPLKKLQIKIRKVANGELDFLAYNYTKNDEIAEIATEFDKTMEKFRDLLFSRQLFLRSIMHELKTPIGKGRIIAEFLESQKQKNRLIKVFERLDNLVNELAKVELILSKNYTLVLEKYHFSLILKQAKEYLMLENVDKKISTIINYDPLLRVDLDLFSTMLKNLIDNALKYSNDGKCEVSCEKNFFQVKNKGLPLKYEFSHYLQPFVREDNKSTIKGMGLGLYIINHICSIQGLNLVHEYEKDHHNFKIFFKA